ncbi:hypothetical protein [Elioraea tepidiphila]|jgi:hypothetical protein|uniref:hypothetical protein n=1 Tax=Elioraea tepidiphila TaxID=457934 RepID=UPI002FDA8292
MDAAGISLEWWIRVIEVPILVGLFKMMWDIKKELVTRIDRVEQRQGETVARLREELAAFKLEVARGYVPVQLMRELDRRVSLQLMRIEEKLDVMGPRARGRRDLGDGFAE